MSETFRWPQECHPGTDQPLPRDTADLVWQLLLEREGLAYVGESDAAEIDRARHVAATWTSLDDTALWELLADLTLANPEWPPGRCEDIVRAWGWIRSQSPWGSELHRFWERWTQHHRDLTTGLTTAGLMPWPELCTFCHVWTADRRMAPFSRVGELVLRHVLQCGVATATEQTEPPREPKNHHPGACPTFQRANRRREILVITASDTVADFRKYGASRQLMWALDQTGASWSLRQPWDPDLELDPNATAGVVFWSYRHLDRDYVHHAMRIERTCVESGIPVVNSIVDGWDMRHSVSLKNLSEAGIPCPQFQKFRDVDEIELPYPLVLRVDGLHRGRQMHLVSSPDDAHRLVEGARRDFLTWTRRRPADVQAGSAEEQQAVRLAPSRSASQLVPPPNLAVEFVDISDERGRCTKRRALVVGNDVIPRHQFTGTNWLVNFESAEKTQYSTAAHRDFLRAGDENAELVARAGRASGSDITALDYARTADGRYVFWESNRIFVMNGDPDYVLQEVAARARSAKAATKNLRLGKALVKLLQERILDPQSVRLEPAVEAT